MDLINEIDEDHKGYINLETFKKKIDFYIMDFDYYLKLNSKVK
jgi:hypothetical protein